MPTMYNVDATVDIAVSEFFDDCTEYEKEELRDLVLEYFDIADAEAEPSISDILDEKVETETARMFVRKVLKEVAFRIRTNDFSELVVK